MSDEASERVRFMLARQDVAYKQTPLGTWSQRWLPRVCKHDGGVILNGESWPAVRCTHGDEIIHRRYRRRVCMICGRSLEGPLPEMCFFTGEPHVGATDGGDT